MQFIRCSVSLCEFFIACECRRLSAPTRTISKCPHLPLFSCFLPISLPQNLNFPTGFDLESHCFIQTLLFKRYITSHFTLFGIPALPTVTTRMDEQNASSGASDAQVRIPSSTLNLFAVGSVEYNNIRYSWTLVMLSTCGWTPVAGAMLL